MIFKEVFCVTYNDLVCWVVRNQKFDLRNYAFKKFLVFFRLVFDKSNCKITHWSCPMWGNWCNDCSIYYLPFVFSTHWSNRNQACSVSKLVLSRFSNLMNIISKTNWVKSYCLIKKPEYKFSFSFVNSFLKTKQTNKKQKKKNFTPPYLITGVSSIFYIFLPILSTY